MDRHRGDGIPVVPPSRRGHLRLWRLRGGQVRRRLGRARGCRRLGVDDDRRDSEFSRHLRPAWTRDDGLMRRRRVPGSLRSHAAALRARGVDVRRVGRRGRFPRRRARGGRRCIRGDPHQRRGQDGERAGERRGVRRARQAVGPRPAETRRYAHQRLNDARSVCQADAVQARAARAVHGGELPPRFDQGAHEGFSREYVHRDGAVGGVLRVGWRRG